MYLECRFRRAERLIITVERPRCGRRFPRGEDNLIWQTALEGGSDGGSLRPIELNIGNDIPIGKGLGSSAAALTAGVVMRRTMLPARLVARRCWMKRRGSKGIRITSRRACWVGSSRARSIPASVARAVRMEICIRTYGVAVVVPDFLLPTVGGAAGLPIVYSRADAIFNVQRARLLIAALASRLDRSVSGRA